MSTTVDQPTSVRLTVHARKLLDEAMLATGHSRSQLVNQAVEAHLPRVMAKTKRTMDERLAWLDDIVGTADRLGVARTAEEIDASIREMRGDR